MDLSQVLEHCGLEEARASVEIGWPESLRTLPSGGPPFLAEEFVRQACGYCALTEDVTETAVRCAARIAADPCLAALAWHARRRIYEGGPHIREWPLPKKALGADAGMLYLLTAMSNWPEARRVHEAHNIPSDVVRATMNVEGTMRRYRLWHGGHGVDALHAGGWLTNHFTGRIYRLGRLQYIPKPFPAVCHAFQNMADRRLVTLAENELELRADGHLNGAAGLTQTTGLWRSVLYADEARVRGNPIDPLTGVVSRKPIELSADEWREVLKPGDSALEMHIPPGDPLTPEACARSLDWAKEFFPRHFPEAPRPAAFVCTTWLLDPQLAGYLDAESNIVRFMSRFRLFPAAGDPWSAFRFVFDLDIPTGAPEGPDFSTLPRRTRLERALIRHVENGGRWSRAGGYILID